MSHYHIPAERCHWEQQIKRSRFIGHTAYTRCEAESKAFLAEMVRQYPDARHWCWAHKIGPPGQLFREACSDDGEPSGTAGKPILNVLQHNEVTDITLVVVRYFGGIKLGAGGLVRAYSSTASSTLALTPLAEQIPTEQLRIYAPYAFEDLMRRLVKSHSGELLSVDYAEQVSALCEVQADQRQALAEQLGNDSSGHIQCQLLDA